MEKEVSIFAQRLKQYREQLNITRVEMAEYLNITPTAYGAYELGTREPKLNALCKIATFLKVTPNDLLIEKDDTLGREKITSEIYIQQLRQLGFNVRQGVGNIIIEIKDCRWLFEKSEFVEIMQKAEKSGRYVETLQGFYSLIFDREALLRKESYIELAIEAMKDLSQRNQSNKFLFGGENRIKLIEALSKGMENVSNQDEIKQEYFTLEKLIQDFLKKKQK